MAQIILAYAYIFLSILTIGSAFKNSRGLADLMLKGMVVLLSVFSVIYYVVLFVFQSRSMDLLCHIFLGVNIPISLYGLFRMIICRNLIVDRVRCLLLEFRDMLPYVFISIGVIVFQVFRVTFLQPFSLSDNTEYYNVISQMDYSGEIYHSGLTAKYITTSWYVFEAFVSRITGCHGIQIAATVIPMFFLLLSYCAYWRLGQFLFDNNCKKNLIFMLLTAIITEEMLIMSDPAAYMLVWPSWGKNIPPAIVIPCLFVYYMEMSKEKKINSRIVVWMFLFSFVGANATSTSMMAIPILLFALSLVFLIKDNRWDLGMISLIVIIPEIFQFVLFKVFSMGVMF